MRKRTLLVAGLALPLFFLACNQPVKPSDAPAKVTINSTLASLPELKLTLPKSLRLDADTTGKSISRALDDVTDLTTANVGSVKSESWMSLQQGNGLLPFLNRAFGLIENFAKENEISEGKAFSLNVAKSDLASIIGCPEANVPSDLVLKNSFMVKGQDPRDYYLYANIYMGFSLTFDGTTTQCDYYVRCKMHLLTPESGSQKIEMLLDLEADGMVQRLYADIDATTGACTMVSGMGNGDTIDPSMMGIMISEVGSDGSITDINASSFGGSSNFYVAYGNDTAGGIASANSGTYMDCSGNSVKTDNYWGEYYDGNGDIIYRSNGSTNLWYTPSTTDATNLYTVLGNPGSAPEKIYIRYIWYPSSTFEISTDYDTSSTPTWKAFTPNPNGWGWYCMKDSNWASGDTYYYWQGYDQIANGVVYKLYAGFRVPETITFNGKEYYVTNEYPLRNLLPIADPYKAGFSLKQKEGETNSWSWTDGDGNTYTNDYTFYSYWLENGQPLDGSGDPQNCDDSDGDINLNDKLQQYDMYYYGNGAMSKVKSYFFRTTTSLPPYFSNPDPGNLVDSIKSKLQEALDRGASIDMSNYASSLPSLKDDPIIVSMTL
jgi:hypothetical protein